MVTIKILDIEFHDYINDCIPFFALFVLLEVIIGTFVLKKKKYYDLPDTLSSVGTGLSTIVWRRIVTLPILASIEFIVAIYVNQHYALIKVSEDSKLAWIICFICIDFAYYLFHRSSHEINFIWATHVTHHSSEKYNLSTALRQSVWQIYTSWIFFVPIGLFIPPKIYFFHKQFNTIYQFWIHTQLIPKLGPIEWIFNTPSHHRVHHGRNPKYLDKNYAGTLIIWDRLFGTFKEEEDNDPVYYGLVHPLKSNDPTWSQFHHWVEMYEHSKEYSSYREKLMVFLMGPGWKKGEKSRFGDYSKLPIPSSKDDAERDSKSLGLVMNMYLFSHYLFTSIVALTMLAAYEEVLGSVTVTITFIYLYLSLISFGSMFDRKYYSHLLESSRILMFLGYTWSLEYPYMYIVRILYFLSLLYIINDRYLNLIKSTNIQKKNIKTQ
ncbi:SUR2-type hydroxylase/desaturase catalytic region-containing protein [Tieghemostelium lacteum]|uniref:SUR2-type hydroxylase/desaturase catalytic region-containing protein n=1 Tax=Tieghemostelium lacteum TaxID=361077 RepID=A0A151ZD88_TIELA|nr:SUR2-type hydroxylase/desaturase catalytic region-containing protein [Tieghemostelium lacteum]|eukprot:KYQ91885.1 SUR2-type hydroxylase/desaturase catalytic region-containing protein [Tieghemostelium lacteum]